MKEFSDNLKKHGYKALKRHYTLLQKRVFDALADLTPTRLQFVLNCRKDDRDMSFNWEDIDTPTYRLIGDVLAELIGDPKLIITEHDLIISFQRFKELIWTYECVRQGLFKEVYAEDGSVKYVPADTMQAPEQSQPQSDVLYQRTRKRHWARIKSR